MALVSLHTWRESIVLVGEKKTKATWSQNILSLKFYVYVPSTSSQFGTTFSFQFLREIKHDGRELCKSTKIAPSEYP